MLLLTKGMLKCKRDIAISRTKEVSRLWNGDDIGNPRSRDGDEISEFKRRSYLEGEWLTLLVSWMLALWTSLCAGRRCGGSGGSISTAPDSHTTLPCIDTKELICDNSIERACHDLDPTTRLAGGNEKDGERSESVADMTLEYDLSKYKIGLTLRSVQVQAA
jgi:hypothetical protein